MDEIRYLGRDLQVELDYLPNPVDRLDDPVRVLMIGSGDGEPATVRSAAEARALIAALEERIPWMEARQS